MSEADGVDGDGVDDDGDDGGPTISKPPRLSSLMIANALVWSPTRRGTPASAEARSRRSAAFVNICGVRQANNQHRASTCGQAGGSSTYTRTPQSTAHSTPTRFTTCTSDHVCTTPHSHSTHRTHARTPHGKHHNKVGCIAGQELASDPHTHASRRSSSHSTPTRYPRDHIHTTTPLP